MAEPLTAFISSTYLDNAERRRRIEEAVLHAGMLPIGMERFVASTAPTVAECQRLARECDLYVGIVAHRYGHIPDGYDVSITELEYDAAVAAGRDRLMFEIDPGVPVQHDRDYDEPPERWRKQEKLDQFRQKYRGHQMPGLFSDTTLQGRVLHALHEWQRRREGGASGSPPDALERTGEIARYCELVERLHATLELAGF